MSKKGSITVFLSLIMVLLFSFVLTALEGARIRGATAYVAMVSELAGDSFLASYYYPLFKEYRLFGVNAGDEEGYLAESQMTEQLKENVGFGLGPLDGGLLSFGESNVVLEDYKTLLAGSGAEFLSQVRQQTVLDGLSLGLTELFSEEMFTEAGTVGKVYREQEEALEVTATVTKELLKLMELVDGIRMGENGFALDNNGRLRLEASFIKQPVPMGASELKMSYDNEEVYRTISGGLYRIDKAAERVEQLIQKVMELEQKIARVKESISNYERNLTALAAAISAEERRLAAEEKPDPSYLMQLQREAAAIGQTISSLNRQKKSYEEQKKSYVSGAKEQYRELKGKLDGVEKVLKEALQVLERLEKKQKTARISVGAYDVFLKGTKNALSEEVYEVFLKELEVMKLYAGMEEQGFSVPKMQETIQYDLELLQGFSLKGFSENNLSRAAREMNAVAQGMKTYTVENLWFTYGEIVVAEETGKNVMGLVAELLTTGVLSLVGISKEKQSDRGISGVALPSEGMETESFVEELFTCMEQVKGMFCNGDIGVILREAENKTLDTIALELYSRKYFHSFQEESPYTKLNYEREYVVFGKEEDKTNLLYMVLHLVAIRTLFSMVSLLKQPEKTAQLQTLAAGVTGFTGIPLLGAVVKYSLLLLWSVEEALVEVSALLQGKRLPVIGIGTVAFTELFLINKIRIAGKASRIPNGAGASYEDYLTLLSLTRTTKLRAYRTMDLIQENIRYRYNDSFRIRNVVTEIYFCSKAKLKPLFDTGRFLPGVYQLEWTEHSAY